METKNHQNNELETSIQMCLRATKENIIEFVKDFLNPSASIPNRNEFNSYPTILLNKYGRHLSDKKVRAAAVAAASKASYRIEEIIAELKSQIVEEEKNNEQNLQNSLANNTKPIGQVLTVDVDNGQIMNGNLVVDRNRADGETKTLFDENGNPTTPFNKKLRNDPNVYPGWAERENMSSSTENSKSNFHEFDSLRSRINELMEHICDSKVRTTGVHKEIVTCGQYILTRHIVKMSGADVKKISAWEKLYIAAAVLYVTCEQLGIFGWNQHGVAQIFSYPDENSINGLIKFAPASNFHCENEEEYIEYLKHSDTLLRKLTREQQCWIRMNMKKSPIARFSLPKLTEPNFYINRISVETLVRNNQHLDINIFKTLRGTHGYQTPLYYKSDADLIKQIDQIKEICDRAEGNQDIKIRLLSAINTVTQERFMEIKRECMASLVFPKILGTHLPTDTSTPTPNKRRKTSSLRF
jgi:hypothetical protein